MDTSPSSSGSKSKKPAAFNIYRYDAELAFAFQADCENLLQKFSNLQNFSYEEFAKLWKETCFSSVFEGHNFILMLETFLDNCFFMAKKFLFSTDPYIQTGAVYVLYGLYYKQPVREWVKIRLIQTELDKLNEIVEKHKRNKSFQVVFIYNKMRLDGAFQYCALSQPLGLNAKCLKRYDLSSEQIHKKNLRDCPLKKFRALIEQDPELAQLEETDREYQSLVNKYKENCTELFVFPSNIGNELKQAYSRVFDIPLEDYEEQDRLNEIKRKAMANTNAIYRADRSVVTGVDFVMEAKPSSSSLF